MSQPPKMKAQSAILPGKNNSTPRFNTRSLHSIGGNEFSILQEYETLHNSHRQLQEELLIKEKKFEDMSKKLDTLRSQLNRQQSAENKTASSAAKSDVEHELHEKLRGYAQSAKKMDSEMRCLQEYVEALRLEVTRLRKESAEKSSKKSDDKEKKVNPDESIAAIKLDRLTTQFEHLQAEYATKEKQCEELTEKMKNCLDECDNASREKALNETLKIRADNLVREIDENKIFIGELQSQVDMYRDKYMKAQTTVEQQKLTLDSLEKRSQQLDQQVCDEVRRIKEKFQEKLSTLCEYPQKYERSKRELDESKRQIQSLENDLKSSLSALCHAKDELERLEAKCDDELDSKYKQLLCENEMMKKRFCGLKDTRKCLEDKLAEMKNELDKTRKDSAKLIEMTKSRAEENRTTLNQHIAGLEVELAQCRAVAKVSLADKEETIKQLRCELAKLCSHFEFCQSQIKCMKSQIAQQTVRCVAGSN